MGEESDPPSVLGYNPPYGASINYYLRAPVTGDVAITILDQRGEVVQKLKGDNAAGLNRIHWDLRCEPSAEIRLRTSPMHAPWLHVGPEGWRPAPDGGRLSILAPPGTYTVRISAGGRELSQPLVVRKDPNSGGSEAEIAEQTRMLFELRKDLDSAAGMVNRIELVRSQIEGLDRIVRDEPISKACEELNRKLIDLEMNLFELRLTGTGQDSVRWGSRLISKINYLASGLASGDFRPTTQQVEVQREFEERLRVISGQFESLMGKELAGFNEILRKRNVPNIIGMTP
jgi:hypothetical protein